MCFPVNFLKLAGAIGNFFAGHMRTANSGCSLFHDFPEKKTLNWESNGNTHTVFKLKFYLKSPSAIYIF